MWPFAQKTASLRTSGRLLGARLGRNTVVAMRKSIASSRSSLRRQDVLRQKAPTFAGGSKYTVRSRIVGRFASGSRGGAMKAISSRRGGNTTRTFRGNQYVSARSGSTIFSRFRLGKRK